MFCMFRLLEEYVSPSLSIVDALCFVVLLDCMLKLSLEFFYLPFSERQVSTVFYVLNNMLG
jgi:hypothetical protein